MNLGQNPNSLDSKRASPKLSQVFQTVPNDEQFPSNLDHILTSKLPSQVASNFNESSTLANLIAWLLNKSLKSYLYSTIPLATHSLTKDQIFEVSPSRFSWFMGKSMKFYQTLEFVVLGLQIPSNPSSGVHTWADKAKVQTTFSKEYIWMNGHLKRDQSWFHLNFEGMWVSERFWRKSLGSDPEAVEMVCPLNFWATSWNAKIR